MASTVAKDQDAGSQMKSKDNISDSKNSTDTDNRHGTDMMQKFHSFLNQSKFCDITINIGGRSFQAHKMVLAAASEYFESMFSGGFVESTKSEIEIEGDGPAFKILLEYAYTGKLTVAEGNIVKVLSLACYMQFDKVIKECSTKLKDYLYDGKILCEDAFTVAMMAKSYGEPVDELLDWAVSAMAFYFSTFMTTETFLADMRAELLEQVLVEPNLACSAKEEEALTGLINWLSHDLPTRKQHAAKLVKMLRLGVIPAAELEKAGDFFDKHDMAECCEILRRIVKSRQPKCGGSSKGADSDELHDMFTPRNIVTAPLVIGGSEDDTTVSYFNKRNVSWTTPPWKFVLPPTGTGKIMGHSSVVVDDVLYVVGGSEGLDHEGSDDSFYDDLDNDEELLVNKVRKYDPESNSWIELARMQSVRSDFALVHLDGLLYAVGGKSYGGPVKSVECYDISENMWKSVASLTCYYGRPKAVVFNGNILMYGVEVDYFGQSLHQYSLELYDPVHNVWKKVMSEKYWKAAFHEPILTVQDGECYRVVCQVDKEKTLEEQLESEFEMHVNKITIKERGRNGRVTAVMGKKEKQVHLKCRDAFCLNGKVFVYLAEDSTLAFDTGVDVKDIGPNGLDKKWHEVTVNLSQSVVRNFTFDIMKLKPKQ
ncbi:kelch-like protein 26 isoform X1 [Amphiura filiformis]|uniref:kelch-like protein 26 isoform X1 n=1 Tax=Amphiura filiformis TaxID=82378 RepID=UPI003B228B1B